MTVEEMRESGARRATRRGIETLDERVAKRAGLDPKELKGVLSERDSPTVQELKTHTLLFNKMNERLDYIARGEKMPQKNQGNKK